MILATNAFGLELDLPDAQVDNYEGQPQELRDYA
jgi:hypothetical protein